MRISDWSSDVCSSDLLCTPWSDPSLRLRSGPPRIATNEPEGTFERATCLLRADIVAALVVLIPQPCSGVLLLIAVLDDSDPLTLARVLCHEIGRASGRERVCQYV